MIQEIPQKLWASMIRQDPQCPLTGILDPAVAAMPGDVIHCGDPEVARTCAACRACLSANDIARHMVMAFQPIIEIGENGWSIFAHEALARGPAGQPALGVFRSLRDHGDAHLIDQACRLAALREAVELGLHAAGTRLSLNVLPNAVLRRDTCLSATVDAAERLGFAPSQLMFEITEVERIRDIALMRDIVGAQRSRGVRVAIDDFGAGHAGLGLLVEFQPDMVKLDPSLLRGIDGDSVRTRIARAIVSACQCLGITVIAEGVETAAEMLVLHGMGVRHFQGFFLARPAFRSVAGVNPAAALALASLST